MNGISNLWSNNTITCSASEVEDKAHTKLVYSVQSKTGTQGFVANNADKNRRRSHAVPHVQQIVNL